MKNRVKKTKKKQKRRAVVYRKRSSGIGFVIVIVLVFCGIMFVKKLQLDQQKEQYQTKLAVKEKEYQELLKEKESIEEYKTYVQTKSYIEQVAREKLGLVYEDEVLFESKQEE